MIAFVNVREFKIGLAGLCNIKLIACSRYAIPLSFIPRSWNPIYPNIIQRRIPVPIIINPIRPGFIYKTIIIIINPIIVNSRAFQEFVSKVSRYTTGNITAAVIVPGKNHIEFFIIECPVIRPVIRASHMRIAPHSKNYFIEILLALIGNLVDQEDDILGKRVCPLI